MPAYTHSESTVRAQHHSPVPETINGNTVFTPLACAARIIVPKPTANGSFMLPTDSSLN